MATYSKYLRPANQPCDYCGAPDAPANMLNLHLALHQFGVASDARNAYDRARYGKTYGHPSKTRPVEDLIKEYMTQFNIFKNITVRICEPCRLADLHADDRDTPVLGVNCVSKEARMELVEKSRAIGEACRLQDEEAAQWRHPSTY